MHFVARWPEAKAIGLREQSPNGLTAERDLYRFDIKAMGLNEAHSFVKILAHAQ